MYTRTVDVAVTIVVVVCTDWAIRVAQGSPPDVAAHSRTRSETYWLLQLLQVTCADDRLVELV